MKIKTTRICSRKGCNTVFKLHKSTDRHCSFECAKADQKPKDKKTPYKIKPVSEKRKRQSYIYRRKRKTFLALPENQLCPVAKLIFNEDRDTTEVHHKAGRRGKLLNYVPFWLAVSSKGHKWIHANPKKAYELDFLIRSTTVNI